VTTKQSQKCRKDDDNQIATASASRWTRDDRPFKLAGFLLVAFALTSLTGCKGVDSQFQPSVVILPPGIKSIAVRPFENETSQPAINNKLWLATTDEFIRDGRIAYIAEEAKADGVVVGTIRQYRETALSYDTNLVPLEYQLWIIMDLKFLDRPNNQYLWHEPYIEQKLRYFAETAPGGQTVEQAREELWSRFANDIVRRTIEGFGSVTSSSPRSVPKDPVKDPVKEPRSDNPPPKYPNTAPF